MTELLSAIAAATSAAGHEVEFAFDEFPPLPNDGVYVVIPHEFHGYARPQSFPTRAQCRRTIALCTENPGTPWFDIAADLAPRFAAVVAINRSSVAELKRRGIESELFQLGYSPHWDSWQRDESIPRPIDVLYLGAADPRRDPVLASYGRYLWDRTCQFLVPSLDARGAPSATYLTGVDKHHRLRASRILLNLHRGQSRSLEWPRVLEAACNGCVVVSEPCIDNAPLVPGEHFIAADAESLPLVAEQLLDDPHSLQRIARTAYDFVRSEMRMDAGVDRLVAVAGALTPHADAPAALAPRDSVTPLPPPNEQDTVSHPTPEREAFRAQRAALRALDMEMREIRRALAELVHRTESGEPSHIREILRTPAYETASPRVSVLITVHNYEREVLDALSSVATSSCADLEALLIDDASTDGSLAAVVGFLNAHSWLPARLLHHPVNRGLGHARNALIEHARGDYVFILDADNGIYPTALEKLVAALDAGPENAFAYSMVAEFHGDRPVSLINQHAWDPGRLRNGNYIDAMALIRRQDLVELGGYTTDPRLTGWEDFHLWCRCAETARRGELVPEILAWYRRREHSMLRSETEISTTAAWSVMRERFPQLLGRRSARAAAAAA